MCSHGDHGGGDPCSASVANFEQHSEGMEYLMEAFIDRSKVIVLNEEAESSGVKMFKRWADRFDKSICVDSDVDEELLFIVLLNGHVKLTGVTFIGELSDSHPSRVRIFKDRELNFSFDSVTTAKPDQEMQLKQDNSASIDYPLIAFKVFECWKHCFPFPLSLWRRQDTFVLHWSSWRVPAELQRLVESRSVSKFFMGDLPLPPRTYFLEALLSILLFFLVLIYCLYCLCKRVRISKHRDGSRLAEEGRVHQCLDLISSPHGMHVPVASPPSTTVSKHQQQQNAQKSQNQPWAYSSSATMGPCAIPSQEQRPLHLQVKSINVNSVERNLPLNTAPKDAMGLNLNNANSRESGDGASSYSGVLDSEKKFDCGEFFGFDDLPPPPPSMLMANITAATTELNKDNTTVTLKQQHIHFLPSRDEFTANQGPVKCNEANAGQQERIVQAASENAQDSNKEHISNSNLEQKDVIRTRQAPAPPPPPPPPPANLFSNTFKVNSHPKVQQKTSNSNQTSVSETKASQGNDSDQPKPSQEPNKFKAPNQSASHLNLFEQIKAGVQLRKVAKREEQAAVRAAESAESNDVAAVLRKRMEACLGFDDDSSGSAGTNDDNEWE